MRDKYWTPIRGQLRDLSAWGKQFFAGGAWPSWRAMSPAAGSPSELDPRPRKTKILDQMESGTILRGAQAGPGVGLVVEELT